jgi:hypothetical protein
MKKNMKTTFRALIVVVAMFPLISYGQIEVKWNKAIA